MVNLLIGIVTYNSRDIIARCLDAVLTSVRNIKNKIMIYDNASLDETPQLVLQKFPNVELIASNENRGYASGVNEIANKCSWNYYLIMNPDVIVNESTIPLAINFMQSNSQISLLGANLTDSNGNPVHSFGDLPTPTMFQFDFSGLRRIFPHPNWSSTKSVSTQKNPFEVGYVTGAFMLIARDAWDAIGAFDKEFFLYFEDTDWAYRLHKANRKAMIHPLVKAIHVSGASFGKDEASIEYKMKCYFESAYKYFEKHFGEKERNATLNRIMLMAKAKLFILWLHPKKNNEAIKRQNMIIKIHQEIAQNILKH